MPDISKSKFHTQGYTVTSTLRDASATLVYTVPNNYSAFIRYLHLSNNNTSTQKVYVQFYHKDDNAYHYIANGLTMSGNSVFNLVNGGYFNLHQGDKIVASVDTPGILDIMISAEEYYDPVRG